MADIICTVFLAILIVAILSGGIGQDKINRACEDKGGVLSYSDHTWGVTAGTGTVVCGDHKAYKINL